MNTWQELNTTAIKTILPTTENTSRTPLCLLTLSLPHDLKSEVFRTISKAQADFQIKTGNNTTYSFSGTSSWSRWPSPLNKNIVTASFSGFLLHQPIFYIVAGVFFWRAQVAMPCPSPSVDSLLPEGYSRDPLVSLTNALHNLLMHLLLQPHNVPAVSKIHHTVFYLGPGDLGFCS